MEGLFWLLLPVAAYSGWYVAMKQFKTARAEVLILTLAAAIVVFSGGRPAKSEVKHRRLSVAEYRDKMKAGWIGQIAGVC